MVPKLCATVTKDTNINSKKHHRESVAGESEDEATHSDPLAILDCAKSHERSHTIQDSSTQESRKKRPPQRKGNGIQVCSRKWEFLP